MEKVIIRRTAIDVFCLIVIIFSHEELNIAIQKRKKCLLKDTGYLSVISRIN